MLSARFCEPGLNDSGRDRYPDKNLPPAFGCAAMKRTIAVVVAGLLLTGVPAQELPKQLSGGPGKPLPPAEAQKLFRLPAGLRIELVAAEPQIESPVAMAFAGNGRLWVVEMGDYPNGPSKGDPPAGRIKILDDKDGDGFFE